MALQLARALKEAGATVIMPRTDDSHVSLEGRYNLANARTADIFISFHCNAMARRGTMSGTETYYCTPQSLALAQALHPQVVGVMAGRDGGIRRRSFAVVRHTTMPSVLLEVGYIDNPGDEARLGDPIFQEELGNAVRDGVIRYFGG
jgi:N-acetylmuramoyl-L-alanine amidase